ncbi:MAG: hypothetical protein AAGJ81_04005 [Verrucomicrobiota bacterium]
MKPKTLLQALFVGLFAIANSSVSESTELPDSGQSATEVSIAVTLLDLLEVNEPSQSFRARGFLSLRWIDPDIRLENVDQPVEQTLLGSQALAKLENIWWPQVEFINAIGARTVENRELILKTSGEREYREIFDASFQSSYDLRKFPRDSQQLKIAIESFAHPEDQLVWAINREQSVVDAAVIDHVVEWEVVDHSAEVLHRKEVREETVFSEAVFTYDVERKMFFYFTRIFLPFSFFLLLSTCVFWMENDALDRRVSIVFSANLTAVAFSFFVSRQLPRVPYLTLMDQLIISGYLMTGICVATVIAFERAKINGNERLWKSGNFLARFLMPSLYVIVWASILVVSL